MKAELALAPVTPANDADVVKVESPLPSGHDDPKHSHACWPDESVEQKEPLHDMMNDALRRKNREHQPMTQQVAVLSPHSRQSGGQQLSGSPRHGV